MWDRSENQIKIALIRHGATPANKEHRYLGSTDEDLSPDGRTALLQAKASGIYPEVDVLFSSPMKRCLSTGELLYPGQIPIVISDWREMVFPKIILEKYGSRIWRIQKSRIWEHW